MQNIQVDQLSYSNLSHTEEDRSPNISSSGAHSLSANMQGSSSFQLGERTAVEENELDEEDYTEKLLKKIRQMNERLEMKRENMNQ